MNFFNLYIIDVHYIIIIKQFLLTLFELYIKLHGVNKLLLD